MGVMLARTVDRLGSTAGPAWLESQGPSTVQATTRIADGEGCRCTPDSKWPSRRGAGNPNDQSATWEPMITVRSPGSPKWSIGLDALRAIAMNRFLRQRCMPGASVGVIVIREAK